MPHYSGFKNNKWVDVRMDAKCLKNIFVVVFQSSYLQRKVTKFTMSYLVLLLYLSCRNGSGANKTNECEKSLCEDKRNMFGARIKIMWEKQIVDPPIDYITSVNVP